MKKTYLGVSSNLIVHTKQRINILFLITFLFTGIVVAAVSFYFLADHRLMISLVTVAHLLFCGVFIFLEVKKKQSLIKTERERAELAENYIKELQDYVTEQEKVNKSLKVK